MINEILESVGSEHEQNIQTERTNINSLVYSSVELLRFKAVEKKTGAYYIYA